jgi:hypothetical protein
VRKVKGGKRKRVSKEAGRDAGMKRNETRGYGKSRAPRSIERRRTQRIKPAYETGRKGRKDTVTVNFTNLSQ